MIKGVIFDFDGLLVDSEPIYVNANKKFLSERGITDFSVIEKLFGMRAEEAFSLMKKEHNLDGSIEELMNIRNQYILNDFKNGKLNLMPNVTESLEHLKNHFLIAIGSSSKQSLLASGMESCNIEDLFKIIVCGDDVEKGKPEPDIYIKVAEKLGLDPEECIVIEDAPNGVLAGKRAGMLTVAIPNEQTKDLDFPDPDYMLHSFKELCSMLDNINTHYVYG